jgi:DNA-binding transcriptional ArsR family regulator
VFSGLVCLWGPLWRQLWAKLGGRWLSLLPVVVRCRWRSDRYCRRYRLVFRVLANETRLRLLHALVRADELPVGQLAAAVAMKPQAVSNQLQRLADLGIVAARREGTSICYRLVDLCVRALLEQGLCLMEQSLPGHVQARSCC